MNETLYLFPDTNVLLQCKPLGNVSFAEITDCDEIHVIITRPIQQEIDRQKGKGSTRLAKKARNAAALFDKILDSPDGILIVRARSPRVCISMDLSLKPSCELSEQLDYNEADDRFVGIVAGYSAENKDLKVALITNDSGPRFSAMQHNLNCYKVPSLWMLPPETDEKDKKIKELEGQIKELTRSRPEFEIKISENTECDVICPFYTAMSEDEVNEVMSILINAFPMVTDFDAERNNWAQSIVLGATLGYGSKGKYIPASESEVAKYKSEYYPEWVKQCEEVLKKCHEKFNPLIAKHPLSFLLNNVGSVVAERAVVTFKSNGKIALSGNDWDINEELVKNGEVNFQSPPIAPKGRWKSVMADMEALRYGHRFPPIDMHRSTYDYRLPDAITSRHKNDFYYKRREVSPVLEISLECEEWRHKTKDAKFSLFAYIKNTPGVRESSIQVRIEANNIIEPITKDFKLKVAVEEISIFPVIMEMVREFIQGEKDKGSHTENRN
ncbi:PIN domain-containing protein [Raoultella sp. BIGb0149]|uniref:PIN domain-containing protein n=1 Tax=Raoultella sp. BIGb0149 TaxID=2485116 RepID=UPI00105B2334|nr:PIN domain-containing protein [Raoultella sp. BIGb0149]TDQ27272.1 PIN domain-containing protein [Raoultella sp. BIGb0149]